MNIRMMFSEPGFPDPRLGSPTQIQTWESGQQKKGKEKRKKKKKHGKWKRVIIIKCHKKKKKKKYTF